MTAAPTSPAAAHMAACRANTAVVRWRDETTGAEYDTPVRLHHARTRGIPDREAAARIIAVKHMPNGLRDLDHVTILDFL